MHFFWQVQKSAWSFNLPPSWLPSIYKHYIFPLQFYSSRNNRKNLCESTGAKTPFNYQYTKASKHYYWTSIHFVNSIQIQNNNVSTWLTNQQKQFHISMFSPFPNNNAPHSSYKVLQSISGPPTPQFSLPILKNPSPILLLIGHNFSIFVCFPYKIY